MKLYPNISIFFLIWLLVILFVSFLGFLTLPHSGNFSNDFFKSFSNWDGGHFLGIAQAGYSEKFQYAFFPIYPLTIRGVNEITQNFLVSAILISVTSTFLGLQLLYKLITFDFNKKIAERVILFMLIFPTSFYFLTAYSEGLFFLFVISTFLFLRKGNLFLAAVFAVFSSATRIQGLAVVLALLLEVQLRGGFNKKNWYVILSPMGALIYSFYLYQNTGDPFYFLQAEHYWQRNLAVPAVSFWETIKSLSQSGFINNHFNAFLDLIFAIFGVGLAVRAFRFLPSSYSIYILASVLFPLFTPTLSSMPRFLLPIFPIFILIALTKNKFFTFGYQLISIMLLSAFTILFINGYWVS